MWTIFTYGNGDIIADIFRALTLLVDSDSFQSLLRLVALIGTVGVIGAWAFTQRFFAQVLLGFVILVMVVASLRADVSIEDQVNGALPDVVVEDVPSIVALPAYVTGVVGFRFLTLMEAVYGVPGDYRLTAASYNRIWFDFQKVLDVYLVESDLGKNLNAFIVHCVFPGLNWGHFTLEPLQQSTNLLDAIAVADHPGFAAPVYQDGIVVGTETCDNYHRDLIDPQFDEAVDPGYAETMLQLQMALQPDTDFGLDELDYIEPILDALGVGQDPKELIDTMIIRNAFIHAQMEDRRIAGDVAGAVQLSHQGLMQQLKEQAYLVGEVAQKLAPMVRTMAEGLVYIMAPVMVVLAFTLSLGRWVGSYLRLFVWLQLWSIVLVVFNFVLYEEGVERLPEYMGGVNGVAIVNWLEVSEFTALLNSIAGQSIWSVPLVAWGVVSMFGHGMFGLISALQRPVEAAHRVGAEFGRGRGQAFIEGEHYVEQSTTFGGGEMPRVGHSPAGGGFMVMHQSGFNEVLHHDGSTTVFEPGGNVRHSGTGGNFVTDGEGHLLSGTRRSVFTGDDGQAHVATETIEEGGARKISRTEINPYTGNPAQMERFEDAYTGTHFKSRFVEQRGNERDVFEVSADGAAVQHGERVGWVDFGQAGGGGLQHGTLKFTKEFRSGETTPEGNVPFEFVGSTDQETRHVRGVVSSFEEAYPELRGVSGAVSNVTDHRTLSAGGQTLEEHQLNPAGSGIGRGTELGYVMMDFGGGVREMKQGVVQNQYRVHQDGEQLMTSGHVVSTVDGLRAEGKMVMEREEIPADTNNEFSDGQPTVRTQPVFRVSKFEQSELGVRRYWDQGLDFVAIQGDEGSANYRGSGNLENVQVYNAKTGQPLLELSQARVEEVGKEDLQTGERTASGVSLQSIGNMKFSLAVSRRPGETAGFDLVEGEGEREVEFEMPEGPHGLPVEVKLNEDGSFSFRERGSTALPVDLGQGQTESIEGIYEFSGSATLAEGKSIGESGAFQFHTEVGNAEFQTGGVYGRASQVERFRLGVEEGQEGLSIVEGNVSGLVRRQSVTPNRAGQDAVVSEGRSPSSGAAVDQQILRRANDQSENIISYRGEAAWETLVPDAPESVRSMPVFADVQFGRDGSILRAEGEQGVNIRYIDPERGAGLIEFDPGSGKIVFERSQKGLERTEYNTEQQQGVVAWTRPDGTVIRGAGKLEYDPETHELVSADLSSLAFVRVADDGMVIEEFSDAQTQEWAATRRFSGDMHEGLIYSTGTSGEVEEFGGRELRNAQGDLVTSEVDQTVQKIMATDNDALARVHESNSGEALLSVTQKGEIFTKKYESAAEFGPVHMLLEAIHDARGDDFDPTQLSPAEERVIDAVGAGRMTLDTAWDFLKVKYLKEGLKGRKRRLKPGDPLIPD